MQLLDFVAIYGLCLMPIGAVIVVEHWLFPRLGLTRYWTQRRKLFVNVPALISWVAVLMLCFPFEMFFGFPSPMEMLGVHLFFRWLPGWFIAAGLYTVICLAGASVLGTREALPLPAEGAVTAPAPAAKAEAPLPLHPRGLDAVARAGGIAAAIGLLACLVLPLWVFLEGAAGGDYDANLDRYKQLLLAATIVYFIGAVVYFSRREKARTAAE